LYLKINFSYTTEMLERWRDYLVAGHFIWRIYLLHMYGSMGFVNGSWFDLFWICVHTGFGLEFNEPTLLTWFLIWNGIDAWIWRVVVVFGTIMLDDIVWRTHDNISRVLAMIHILHAKTVDSVFALSFGMMLRARSKNNNRFGWQNAAVIGIICWYYVDDGYFTRDFYWIALIYFCFMRRVFNANKYLLWGLIVASHVYGTLELGARLC
jgi:hypothetical protein